MGFFLTLSCSGNSGSDGNSALPGVSGTGTGTNTVPGDAVGIALEIGVRPDANQAWFESFSQRLRESNQELWSAVHGQMYFSSIDMYDNEPEGTRECVIDKLTGYTTVPPPGPPASYGWTLISKQQFGFPGEYIQQAFLHEWGHHHFLRHNEEYSCSQCAMGDITGPSSDTNQYCDGGSCRVADPCWENYILKKYAGWQHPKSNPNPTAPETVIQFNDN
jgi:hypothetical protein